MSWNRFLKTSNTLLSCINIFSHCRWSLGIFFLAATSLVYAGVPADENYDDNSSYAANSQNSFSLDGVKYTITGNTTYSTITSNNSGASPLGNNGSDYFLLFDSSGNFNVSSIKIEATDGSYFRLSGISIDALADNNVTITPYNGATAGTPVSYVSNGIYITQQNINLSGNTSFQYITSVVISGGNLALGIDDLNFEAAVPPAPTVTDAKISISGASGSSGAYKIGDTVTATWNNTAGGDNNSGITGVTVDFSQFGGGAAVTASNSSNTWTATFTIIAGSIDTTNRNVSVTATNSGGSTTTADTSNATVDSIAPTVTDAKISISGGSGISGAYKIGDTVTATWNNTAGGDNNSDTISSVTVNFTQFGGGAAVSASNSSGTWTATYTIVAGAIDGTNKNVTVTATDNAGNATSTSDSTNATVDNIAPSVSSIAVSGSPASTDTSMAFTVTLNESVSNISTDDFTLVGTGTATGAIGSVSASSGTSVNVNITGISGNGTLKVNLNGSTNIVDHVGNAIPTYTSGSTHTVAIPTAPGAPTIGTATAGDAQISVTFTAPGSNGGSPITTYTATTSPGAFTGTCAGPAACTITVTGLTNGTAYTATVTATNAIGTGSASGASNSVTPKGSQTITFANPGAQTFGTSPTLTATATSSLTPTFSSSTTSVCTITSGGTLTFVTAGTCTIDADQAGNGSWNAAPTVSHSFTVNAVVPGAPTIGTATAGNTQATVTFSAPASTGGASITGYTVTANPGGATATGANSPITVTGLSNGVAYTFTVTATNSVGTGAASAASNSITPASPQTITFANPGAQNFGTNPSLSATSTSSLTVSFSSSTTSVCTVSGSTLTFVTAGTCTINADQAGNTSYLPASQVSRSFTVNPVAPAAPTAATATAGDTSASVAFTAPANTGGASITGYTVTSNPGGLTGTGASSPVTVTGLTNGVAYTFTVTATNSAGTGSASAASNSITPAATQTITFANPGAQNFGTTPTLTATADSGLTPTFTSSTTSVCTITSGGALTFVTTGTCTINANQAGNGSYLPAAQVSRSFTVNAVVPGAPTIGVATAGDTQASIAFSAPAFTGGATITGYTVTSNPGGFTGTGSGSPITVTGLTNSVSYTFTVTATNTAGTGSASAASNAVTPAASQTITFANPGAQTLGNSLNLTATASSGLTPTFTSSTTSVCTVTSGGAVTLISSGTCTISANQAGNANYLAATPVTRSFTVNPIPNRVPSISGSPATSISEGVGYSFTPTGTDADSDPLTYSISNKPSWASFNATTGALTGTPTNANVGTTTGIVISVSDGSLSASLPAFSLTVINVNDAPVISGAPSIKVDQDKAYQFLPTASDADKDTLTFSIANKPSWASFDAATGALSGTPSKQDIGTTAGIVISVSDGTLSASLPAFAIEVVSTIDPSLPVVKAPADLEIDATALFTPVTLKQLLSLSSSANQADIDQTLKALASDGISGTSCCTTNPEGLTASNSLILAPGRHEVKWTATNATGVTSSAIQVVNIRPLVSLSKSQVAVRGNTVEFRVILNGPAPKYPLSIPYAIDSATSATTAEHNLTNGSAIFTEGQLETAIPVTLTAITGLSDSQLVITLGTGINAGSANRHVIDIRQGNVPPTVSLDIRQNGLSTSLISPTAGPVTASITVTDPNKGDTHTFDWSATSGLADTDGKPADASRTFDPSGLTGSHELKVTVTDSAGASVQAQAYFRVVATLPALSQTADTDKDGFSDALEGTGDDDSNGIPDYLDNMPSSNILPQTISTTNSYLIECDPGVRCGLGLFARSGNSGGVQVLNEEVGKLDNLKIDPTFEPVGGIFDFAIRDLPTPGQSVRVVIPQQAAIPANAVYRKFHKGQWVNFIVNANNAIHSTAGNPGYCPPPGSNEWKPGLTQGHLCVQLTIEDGGANDDDGLVNSAVVDPGAVSVAQPVVPPVEPPSVEVKAKRGGAMDIGWLLLLSGLLLIQRVKPKSLALVALVLASASTQADNTTYVRGDVYQAKSDQSESNFTKGLANYSFSLNSYDTSNTGYQLAFGYQWNSLTYTELGYLSLGDAKVNLTLSGKTDLAAFATDFAKQYPCTGSGVTLTQGVSLPLNTQWKVSAEVGIFAWQDRAKMNVANIKFKNDNGVDILFGTRVDYQLNDEWSLGLSARRIAIEDQHVDLFGISAAWRF